jgi:pyruvate/2-oxoglutarate dehydrogenase complex dihydrolipoamide dehydrogenase (E3) component
LQGRISSTRETPTMTKPEQYDAIVIGTGQGGGPLAGRMASAGWRTAIVEREHVGGSCVNVGCTPTKTMVASARVAHLAKRAADYGVNVGPFSIDQQVVRRRKRDIVESFSSGSRRGLERWENLDLLMGEGSFAGPKNVVVALNEGGERRFTAEKIFINTGARPTVPDLPGLDSVSYLDSSSIMELDAVPKHLMVLGGGYVGLEFGQMFHRFGSEVTIVERQDRLAPREDKDVCGALQEIFRDDGIELTLGSDPQRVSQSNGAIRLTFMTADGERTIEGSHLLVAVGRTPNSDRLNLDKAGVNVDDRGFIPVNERLETTVPGIYALGDVKGGPAFTHISYDDYRVLRTNLLEGGSATTAGRFVPYTVFIDPQLGRVGLTEERAREEGFDVRVATMPMSHVARALEVDETRGLMKVVVDGNTRQILGCAVLGIEGGEVMSMIQIAMMGKLPYTALRDATFAHPTLAEALNNLCGKITD